MGQTHAKRFLPSGSPIRLVARCVAIPLAAAALLLLGACGGDDDDKTGATATSTNQASATSEAEGIVASETTEATPEGDDEGDGTSGDATDVDACSLLTTDEVALTLGADVSEGVPENAPPFAGCQWTSTASFDFLRVDVLKGISEDLEAFYNINADDEEVGGIGDKAHWNSLLKVLETLQGDFDLSVQIGSATIDDEDAKFQASGLAERALGRLP